MQKQMRYNLVNSKYDIVLNQKVHITYTNII